MTKSYAKLISFGAMVLSLVFAATFNRFTTSAQETNKAMIFEGDRMLASLPEYRQWKRVNDLPLPVKISAASISTFQIEGTFS